MTRPITYKRHRFPKDVIRYAWSGTGANAKVVCTQYPTNLWRVLIIGTPSRRFGNP